MRRYILYSLLVLSFAIAGCTTVPVGRGGREVIVVSHNVGDSDGTNVPVETILDAYRGVSWPDIFILQEVGSQGRVVRIQRELAERSGRDYDYAYAQGMGIAIVAAGEVTSPRAFVAPASRINYGAFGATVSGTFGVVDVVGVHLDPIGKSRDERGFTGAWHLVLELVREVAVPTVRTHMAREIHAWVETWRTHPVLIGGDFNTVPQSTTARFMRRHYRDVLGGTEDNMTGTYWKIHGPEPRVDYIFCSEELDRLEAYVVRRRAGDHYPVFARMIL